LVNALHTTATALYAITDSQLLPGEKLIAGVSAALEGGCRWVQYRDKSTDAKRRWADACQLQQLCEDHGAQLIINDDLALAKALGASGVHVGQEDACPAAARDLLGENAIIGVTCHNSLALAEAAQAAGASYAAFGRFFPSHTKPHASAAPLSLLREARAQIRIPIVAIGGISLDNVLFIKATGVQLVAVSQGIFAADDIAARTHAFCKLLNTAATYNPHSFC
jgi:thiamine-phosphate pyrophosphorylase